MKKRLSLLLIFVMCISMMPVTSRVAYADTYSYLGAGTEADPYRIRNIDELNELCGDVMDGNTMEGLYFKLMTDIGKSGNKLDCPIGLSEDKPFRGHFDGDGHTVVLDIDIDVFGQMSGVYSLVGMFGALGTGGEAKNVITEGTVTGGSTGASGAACVGGICGMNAGGTIKGCTNRATVTIKAGANTASAVGGICGSNFDNSGTATIIACANYGNVTGQKEYTGGICGYNEGSSSVIKCCVNYAKPAAHATGTDPVGAIYGCNTGTVSDCYYDRDVMGNSVKSGSGSTQVGVFYSNRMKGDSGTTYTSGDMWNGSSLSQFGSSKALIDLLNDFMDDPANSAVTAGLNHWTKASGEYPYMAESYKVTVEQVSNGAISAALPSSYMKPGVRINVTSTADSGYEMESIKYNDGTDHDITAAKYFNMPSENVTVFGTFKEKDRSIEYDYEGAGTAVSPYIIRNVKQLEDLAEWLGTSGSSITDGKHFKLANDIGTLSGGSAISGGLEKPIGEEHPFTGHFDGDGHTIVLNIDNYTSTNIGLFGSLCTNAQIEKVTVKGIVKGGKSGTNVFIGGICGKSEGAVIKNCINEATITVTDGSSNRYTGGICGCNSSSGSSIGIITGCINKGTVNGQEARYTGGICGNNYQSTSVIAGSINYGAVKAPSGGLSSTAGGGICGENKGIIKNCYFDNAVSVATASIHNDAGGTVQNTEGVSTEQMKADSGETFIAGIAEDRPIVDLLNEFIDDTSNATIVLDSYHWTKATGGYPYPAVAYKVTVEPVRNAETSVKPATYLEAGVTANVAVSPDAEYSVKSIQYNGIDLSPAGGNVYSFTMPASAADVKVVIESLIKYNQVGNGTAEAPYEIRTIAQLDDLAEAISTGGNSVTSEKYFTLTADLGSMSGSTVVKGLTTSIGSDVTHAFAGHFDGDGHTIVLDINETNRQYVGLFGVLGEGAEVKNLITDGNVYGGKTGSQPASVGSVCGLNYGGTVIGCINKAKIEMLDGAVLESRTGGICGENGKNATACADAKIINCVNYGYVFGSSYYTTGGVCGFNGNDSYIGMCANYTKPKNRQSDDAGTICARNYGSIEKCYYDSNLMTSGAAVVSNGTAFDSTDYEIIGMLSEQMKGNHGAIYATGVAENKPLVDWVNEYIDTNPAETSGWRHWTKESGQYPYPAVSYKVSVTQPDNGTVSAILASQYMKEGSSVNVSVAADEGYIVNGVKFNTSAATSKGGGNYTFNMPAANVTITAVIQEAGVAPTGGTSKARSINIPVSGEGGALRVKAIINENTATLEEIKAEDIVKAVGDSGSGELTIDLSGISVEVGGVSIPSDTFKAISEAVSQVNSNTAGLILKVTGGTLNFDRNVLKKLTQSIGTARYIEIHLDDVGISRLNKVQQQAIEELEILKGFEAYVKVGDGYISELGGNVTVEIPYKVSNGKTFAAWYVADNGKAEKLHLTSAGKIHSFTVSHFSDYILTYDEAMGTYADCTREGNCPLSSFTDVNINEWYHDSIHYCVEQGLMNGVTEMTFEPDSYTSRAMIVTILWRIAGEPDASGEISFSDVPDYEWFTNQIAWAASEGIVNGYDDGRLGPNDPVTREQLATILYRYAVNNGRAVDQDYINDSESSGIDSFNDALSIEEYAKNPMMWALYSGIIKGDEGHLYPLKSARRTEAATMLQRFCENVIW